MADEIVQVTTDQLLYRDPDTDPPPRGTSMLMLNPGGVCILGVWDDKNFGWCPKPKIPRSIKEKMLKALKK